MTMRAEGSLRVSFEVACHQYRLPWASQSEAKKPGGSAERHDLSAQAWRALVSS